MDGGIDNIFNSGHCGSADMVCEPGLINTNCQENTLIRKTSVPAIYYLVVASLTGYVLFPGRWSWWRAVLNKTSMTAL
jgi:hypothetical protein